jgi:hypothetical protein
MPGEFDDAGAAPRNLGGRPPHAPTASLRDQVEKMAAIGMLRQHIAAVVGVCENTLRLHYEAELVAGDAKGAAKIANTLYQTATAWVGPDGRPLRTPTGSEITALIWFEKTRHGRRERVEVESNANVHHSGAIGGDDAGRAAARALDQLAARLAGGDHASGGLAGDGANEADPDGG